MVSNSTLGAVCVASGLHKHILLAARLTSSVTDYVTKLKAKRKEEYELAQLEKRSPGQYWQEIDPPKVRFRRRLLYIANSALGSVRCGGIRDRRNIRLGQFHASRGRGIFRVCPQTVLRQTHYLENRRAPSHQGPI